MTKPEPRVQVRTWRNAMGAFQIRVKQGPRLPTLSEAREVVRMALGPTGRIWCSPDKVELGYDLRPGRKVLATGATLHMALINYAAELFRDQPVSTPAPESAATCEDGLPPVSP